MKLDSLPLLFAADADPFEGRQMTDLEKHDAKYHPKGYKDGDYCKFREARARGDDADQLAAVEKAEGEALADLQKYIDRYNAIGVLMMAQPLASEPYEKVLAEYGIKAVLSVDSENFLGPELFMTALNSVGAQLGLAPVKYEAVARRKMLLQDMKSDF